MKSPCNVAVVGKMHSGKTTIAQFLVDAGYRRFSFADPVKNIAAKMLTTFLHEVDSTEYAYTYDDMNRMKGHPAIRSLLQLVGTGLGRDWFGPDTIWIDMFEERVKHWEWENKHLRSAVPIVNDDCRFPNEAERLRKLGFVIIKLVRDEDERYVSIYNALVRQNPSWTPAMIHEAVEEMQDHPSETNVDNIQADYTIKNVSIDQLRTIANTIGTEDFRTAPSEWFL